MLVFPIMIHIVSKCYLKNNLTNPPDHIPIQEMYSPYYEIILSKTVEYLL